MKKLTSLLLVGLSAVILSSCATQMANDWTSTSYSGASFKKIAIVGINEELAARVVFEETGVEAFQKEGLNAINGIKVFPQNFDVKAHTPQSIIKLIQDNKIDAVITMNLVGIQERERYQPGRDILIRPGIGYGPAIGLGYGYFGEFYLHRYGVISTPGYYKSTTKYVIEVILHDLRPELFEGKQTLVWRGESALVDPSSLNSAARQYTNRLVRHLVQNGIIKK